MLVIRASEECMNVVHKYKLEPRTTLYLPRQARILNVGIQRSDDIVMWVLHQFPTITEPRNFICVFTGDPFDDVIKSYIGTVTSNYGIVWHVFEVEL